MFGREISAGMANGVALSNALNLGVMMQCMIAEIGMEATMNIGGAIE